MSLQLISEYISSEESESEPETIIKKLPTPQLPEFQKCKSIERPRSEDPSKHQNRIRSIAHEPGNWVSSIYIPCSVHLFAEYADSLKLNLSNFKLSPIEQPHISLSKVFVIRHHWIDTLWNSLKLTLGTFRHFDVILNGISVFLNEDETRTFIALDVCSDKLCDIVNHVDQCLKEFNLPCFYEERLFHVSILWILGNYKKELEKALVDLNLMYTLPVRIDRCIFKTGDKLFSVCLK